MIFTNDDENMLKTVLEGDPMLNSSSEAIVYQRWRLMIQCFCFWELTSADFIFMTAQDITYLVLRTYHNFTYFVYCLGLPWSALHIFESVL